LFWFFGFASFSFLSSMRIFFLKGGGGLRGVLFFFGGIYA
jgi:hypothetical protein